MRFGHDRAGLRRIVAGTDKRASDQNVLIARSATLARLLAELSQASGVRDDCAIAMRTLSTSVMPQKCRLDDARMAA